MNRRRLLKGIVTGLAVATVRPSQKAQARMQGKAQRAQKNDVYDVIVIARRRAMPASLRRR